MGPKTILELLRFTTTTNPPEQFIPPWTSTCKEMNYHCFVGLSNATLWHKSPDPFAQIDKLITVFLTSSQQNHKKQKNKNQTWKNKTRTHKTMIPKTSRASGASPKMQHLWHKSHDPFARFDKLMTVFPTSSQQKHKKQKKPETEKIKSSKPMIPNTTRAASRAPSRAWASPPKMDQSSNQAGKQAGKQARQWWDLNAVIGTNEVLIHSLEPTHIVMGMRHQVHIQFPTHSIWTGVVNSGTKSELLLLLLSITPNAVAAPADPSQHEQQPKTQEGGIDHMMMMMMILLSPLHHQTDGYWISFFLSSPKFPLQNSSSSQVCLQISSSARQRDLFLLV